MKRILLIAMLLLSGIAGAQIVNIPDAELKEKLLGATATNNWAKDINGVSMVIDTNDDNEIQESEALLVYQLKLNSYNIADATGILAFENLTNLEIKDNDLVTLDLTGMANLQILRVEDNLLTDLILTGCTSLEKIWCGDNGLTTLDLTGLTALEALRCWDNNLAALNLAEVNLSVLSAGGNPFTTLDLTTQTQLSSLDLYDCSSLTTVFMKNGVTESINVETFSQCPVLEYICADEAEIDVLNETLDESFGISEGIVVQSYCSYTPGGNYNTITGIMSFDANGNGCGDDDTFNNFIKVTIDDGTESGSVFSGTAGEYNFFTQAGTFTLTPEFENDWFTVTPASATVTLATVDNSTTAENFCITANGIHPDVEVLVVPVTPSQPGFDAEYKIVYRNNGNQILSGDVYFTYDDTVLDYVSASPVENNVSGSTLGWSYTGLMPFESRHMYVTLNVNGPMETPAVNIDDELVFSASISPTAGDETPANNFVAYNETVVGSYDPNDKTCLEGDTLTPAMVGEYLHYNINFENTGTVPATFIVAKDVINPEQFDINTLQVIDASHDMTIKVEGNTVEFRFDAIDLGPLEKGNVLFKVKTLGTLQVNDEVSNYADIFFDYNFPITTNDATSTFQVLDADGFTIDSSVKVYPNPSKGIVTVSADSILTSVALYDLQGRLLHTAMPNHTETILNIADRAAGVYFIKVASEKGSKVEKIIKE